MKKSIIPTLLIAMLGFTFSPAKGEDGVLQRRTVLRTPPGKTDEAVSIATLAKSRFDYDAWKREGEGLITAAHASARSTALQIGVMLEDERFLEPAVDIARRTPIVAHRVSALRVISILGNSEHRSLLLQLRRKGPEPVSILANEALARIDHE